MILTFLLVAAGIAMLAASSANSPPARGAGAHGCHGNASGAAPLFAPPYERGESSIAFQPKKQRKSQFSRQLRIICQSPGSISLSLLSRRRPRTLLGSTTRREVEDARVLCDDIQCMRPAFMETVLLVPRSWLPLAYSCVGLSRRRFECL